MAIVRLQHIGMAAADFPAACGKLERIGLKARDFRSDQGKGYQHDARVLLGNDCWIHVVHNWNPESRVARFLERDGQRLEHIALETDDIEADVDRLRGLKVPIFEDTIFRAADGYEAFVYPDDAVGFTVELIQPHATSWGYPEKARCAPVSEKLGVVRAGHVRAVVRDVREAAERFGSLFGLPEKSSPRTAEGSEPEAAFAFGNRCALLLCSNGTSEPESEGLTELGLHTGTFERDLRYLRAAAVRVRVEGGEQAVIPSEDGAGFAIRLLAFASYTSASA
ncbi:MAG: VOC family protein [Vicinamibacteria bacterium]